MYINSIFDSLLSSDRFEGVVLPIGISFFIFQEISYLVDIYRKPPTKNPKFSTILLYISLFPQLIAGPIVTYHHIQKDLLKREVDFTNYAQGIQRFIIGLSKKVLIADVLAGIIDPYLSRTNAEISILPALFIILLYSLQIFFDFSGYSDMAIGIGKILGFNFPENFNYPYISRSVSEFWRRWNMTLGGWFRGYIYIPLGGNKVSKTRNLLNLSIIFLLTGIWHGAGWTFVLWGIWQGFWVVLERLWLTKNLQKINTGWSHMYLILVTGLGWVLFRSSDLGMAKNWLSSLFNYNFNGLDLFTQTHPLKYLVVLVGVFLSAPIYKNVLNKIIKINLIKSFKVFESMKNLTTYIVLIALYLINLILITGQTQNAFIYFQF